MMERRGKGIGSTCFVWWRGEEKALVQLVLCGGVERRRHTSSLLCVVEWREGIGLTCFVWWSEEEKALVQLAMCGGVERRGHRSNFVMCDDGMAK